jgi:hypothetical protein
MRIVNLEELSKLPNGTVFSEVTCPYFYKGGGGDMTIDGLNIMCGHSDDGYFNGVMHFLNYVTINREKPNNEAYLECDIPSYIVCDTAKCDYEPETVFVVYDETDVIEMINVLQWALTGCKSELFTRDQSL